MGANGPGSRTGNNNYFCIFHSPGSIRSLDLHLIGYYVYALIAHKRIKSGTRTSQCFGAVLDTAKDY